MVVADWLMGTGGRAALATPSGPRPATSGWRRAHKALKDQGRWPAGMHGGGDEALLELAKSALVRSHLRVPGTAAYIVRADGFIVWASPQMEEVTRRAPGDLVGRNGWDVFVPPEDLEDVARFRAFLSQSDGIIWMRLRMPDDGREWYRVDCAVREGGILCAFHREHDPTEQYPHTFMRPPRGSERIGWL